MSYDSWKTRSDRDEGYDPEPMLDPIDVECEVCGGLGVIGIGTEYDWHMGPSVIEGPCPECGGIGREEIDGEPITLEDLE